MKTTRLRPPQRFDQQHLISQQRRPSGPSHFCRLTSELFLTFPRLCVLASVLCLVLYGNSLFNQYALDDGIVISDNVFTMKGFAGIKDIFTHDAFYSVNGVGNELSGGRYRPLSVATFALEIGLFGKNPFVSHLVNVCLYIAVCCLLLSVFRHHFFIGNGKLAIMALSLFLVHPTHTEIVSNIKGRDELLAVLFLLAALVFYLRHIDSGQAIGLCAAALSYFISLLSKESGLPWILVFPLAAFFFKEKKPAWIVRSALVFLIPVAAYFLVRYQVTGFTTGATREVMNAPYVLASASEAFATKTLVLARYIVLLFVPFPLSYDYSYPQIPYIRMSSVWFFGSVILVGGLAGVAVKGFRSKSPLSFSILFFFLAISIVSNFLIDVGSPMNDRFLFQPSIGWAMGLAWLVSIRMENHTGSRALKIVLAMTLVLFSIKTMSRNPDWYDNDTLFIRDVEHVSNSAKARVFAAIAYIKRADAEPRPEAKRNHLEPALRHLRNALSLHPDYADALINTGNVAGQLGLLDEGKAALIQAHSIYPGNRILRRNMQYLAVKFRERAVLDFSQKNVAEAVRNGKSAVECDPGSQPAWYNLGGYYLSSGDKPSAISAWTKALSLDTNNAEIKMWLDRVSR